MRSNVKKASIQRTVMKIVQISTFRRTFFFKVSYAFESVTTYVYLIYFVNDTKFPQIL